jgi:hypothetical protein
MSVYSSTSATPTHNRLYGQREALARVERYSKMRALRNINVLKTTHVEEMRYGVLSSSWSLRQVLPVPICPTLASHRLHSSEMGRRLGRPRSERPDHLDPRATDIETVVKNATGTCTRR